MNQDNPSTSDRLAMAVRALEQTPIAAGPPQEWILRAERIPFSHNRNKSHRIGWIVAALIVLSLGGAAFFLMQRTSEIAFADVVESVSRTHTFTAIEDDTEPLTPERSIKYYARDNDVRFEGATWVQVINHKTGQRLYLNTTHRSASVENNIAPAKCDLYQMLRNYHGNNAQSWGDKIIDGRAVQGFRTVDADSSPPFDIMIIWVDKTTKLPVRMENGPVLMRDFQFDVPLADSLFDTSIPAGYTVPKPYRAAEKFQFAGQVVDDQGNPVANVDVWASQRVISTSSRVVESLGHGGTTDKNGHFSIDASLAFANDNPIQLHFKHPDFLYAQLEDLRLMSPEMQTHLQVCLNRGRSVTGQVVDEAGQPVAGALVKSVCDLTSPKYWGSIYKNLQSDYEKVAETDLQGHFVLHGLPGGKLVVQVQKSAPSSILIAHENVDELRSTTQPTQPLQLTAKPLVLPAATVIHQLFGMKLVDVDASLRDQLSLNDGDKVLVLDAGASVSRLNIGRLSSADAFWMVNTTRINNFQEFVQQLLATCDAQEKQSRTEFDVRVVYDFISPDGGRSNTQYMHLNESDLAELRRVMRP